MSAILVLLALLSVATIASRRGYAVFAANIVTAPLLMGIGVLLSPRALGLFTQNMTDQLLPAMHVGAAWLALLVGLSATRPSPDRRWLGGLFSTLLASGLTWAATSAAAFGLMVASMETEMGFADPAGTRLTALGAALLLGGLITGTGLSFTGEALTDHPDRMVVRTLIFISRHDDVVAAAAVCAAVWLWPLAPEAAPVYDEPLVAVGVIVGLGFTLFCAQLLTGGGKSQLDSNQALIALLGLLVFATGLSSTAVLPAAAMAFFFGGFIAASGRAERMLSRLKKTERPVILAVLILVGTHLGFTWAAVVAGAALAAARILSKVLVRAAFQTMTTEPIPLSALFGSSRAAIPLCLSFALTRPEALHQSDVLTAVCVCVGISDLVTLIAWGRKEREARAAAEADPAPSEDQP